MVERYLSESEIRKLLQCSRCKASPAGPPVYICRTGHLECSACFVKFNEMPKVDETDASTDSESDCASNRKGDNDIGVIFPKEFKYRNNTHHSCLICKEKVLRTRNLFAESLLLHLDGAKPPDKSPAFAGQAKAAVQDGNCVECCYNIYGPPVPRFDSQGVAVAGYDPQIYSRYQVPCGVQQYNYHVDPYLGSDPGVEYTDPNVFYPDYDTMSYCNGRREVTDKRSKFNFAPQSSVMSLAGEAASKRPIRCPTHLCGRNIAVTALSSHFCFDHPDVPPVSVDFDVSSHLFVVPDTIPFNYGRCVAMLLIPNRLGAINSVSQSNLLHSPKNALPLVVMASRLDCITNPQPTSPSSPGCEENPRKDALNHGDFRSRERCRPETPTGLGAPGVAAALGNTKMPLLVIWLAGIEMNSSLFTTLQVTEKQTNIRSVVYTGPVTSLRSSQNTTKVLEQGDCLVIHSGILENIIGDRGGFDLQIVVH